MSIDRLGNTRLAALNPVEHRYVNDDPARSPGASGMEIAAAGAHTLERAEPRGWGTRRDGVTPPVKNASNSEYGDEMRFYPITGYPV